MSEAIHHKNRPTFFEQLHQEFLYLKGYGTYTYITPRDASQLYDTYCAQQQSIASCITQQKNEIAFIRSFIRSL